MGEMIVRLGKGNAKIYSRTQFSRLCLNNIGILQLISPDWKRRASGRKLQQLPDYSPALLVLGLLLRLTF